MDLPQETLDFRRAGFSPALSLLVPAGSLPYAPPVLSIWLQRQRNAPLPFQRPEDLLESAASVISLSPVTLSAQSHLTSELLRFL